MNHYQWINDWISNVFEKEHCFDISTRNESPRVYIFCLLVDVEKKEYLWFTMMRSPSFKSRFSSGRMRRQVVANKWDDDHQNECWIQPQQQQQQHPFTKPDLKTRCSSCWSCLASCLSHQSTVNTNSKESRWEINWGTNMVEKSS